jgi:His/Glu/Gln/Arg/opine family amino acid ABC transporter permease subunit
MTPLLGHIGVPPSGIPILPLAAIYNFEWGIFIRTTTLQAIGLGVKFTLFVSAISLAIGTCIGLFTAVVRISRRPPFAQLMYMYVEFFRTTPVLVQLIWVFYVLPIVLGLRLAAMPSGIIALSLNAGAFLSEIFRAGLESVGRGQRDAAHVLGFSRLQTLRYVIIPQGLRRVLPATGNVFISLLKESSLLSVIAVSELTYQIQSAVARTFRPLELYTELAIVYFILTYPLALGVTALERRFRIT